MDTIAVSKSEYIELLRYKELIRMFEDVLHEKAFRKEFVREVEKIRRDMKEGKKVSFKNVDEMNKYLNRL
jgi:hypothetical protein